MSERDEWNKKVIEEFRTNAGKVSGQFEGVPLLLLHTKGAKSRQERVNPVVYQAVGDKLAVFASKGGAPTSPDWYHNLVANPRVTVELGTDTFEANARVAEDDEREPIWSKQKDLYSGFADYEKATPRQIPVVILERAS